MAVKLLDFETGASNRAAVRTDPNPRCNAVLVTSQALQCTLTTSLCNIARFQRVSRLFARRSLLIRATMLPNGQRLPPACAPCVILTMRYEGLRI